MKEKFDVIGTLLGCRPLHTQRLLQLLSRHDLDVIGAVVSEDVAAEYPVHVQPAERVIDLDDWPPGHSHLLQHLNPG